MQQTEALDILKTGGNVFLTGEPGAGKTHVINEYIAWVEAAGLKVAVTASTGIAATHIGGMTIHAWSGIGARDTLDAFGLDQIAQRQTVQKRVGKSHVLVIDEISMLDGKILEMVDKVCKTVRNRTEPFGGLQVVFVGDFFQLPPVTRQGEMMNYAFQSGAWEAARPLVCYLSDQYRHDDEMLSGLLRSIRRNDIDEEHFTLLSEQSDIGYEDIEPTRLYTHNADVDAVNAGKLKELSGRTATYQMQARGDKRVQEGLVRSCLSPQLLELKLDAMVMFTKNNFEAGYVNGTLGRVVEFDGLDSVPVVETPDGRRIKVKSMTWDVRDGDRVTAEIEQLPLRLAWAITVHKSQGMSLDAVEVDLSRTFVYGQGYVALSRVRTLTGLKVLGMNPNALQVDPRVVSQDERFRAESDAASEAFTAMDATELRQMQENFVTAGGGKLPSDVDLSAVAQGEKPDRLKKESTFEQTKQLLLAGQSVREIAKERDLAETTIWGHVEKLAADGEVGVETLQQIAASVPDWSATYDTLAAIMDRTGIDALKPIFEAAEEQYDYNTIRLARMIYTSS